MATISNTPRPGYVWDSTDNFQQLGIYLVDDSDGLGSYIAKWEYSQPIPAGLKLGK